MDEKVNYEIPNTKDDNRHNELGGKVVARDNENDDEVPVPLRVVDSDAPQPSVNYAPQDNAPSPSIKRAYNISIEYISLLGGVLLLPGKNLRVRKAPKPKKAMIYTCLECGNKVRFGTGEKLKKRKAPKR